MSNRIDKVAGPVAVSTRTAVAWTMIWRPSIERVW
jgi:hypothetical protein